jgi:putative colanic acid biosynthesis acetyltransferase WcaF
MGSHSCLAREVDCYCVAPITIADHALVSQYSFLCSATHDYASTGFELISKPITIGANAWVAADVFIGPGVTLGEGAVIAARSTVVKDVPAREVWAGSPAKFIKPREIR